MATLLYSGPFSLSIHGALMEGHGRSKLSTPPKFVSVVRAPARAHNPIDVCPNRKKVEDESEEKSRRLTDEWSAIIAQSMWTDMDDGKT